MPNSNFENIQYKASNGLINLDEAQGIVECFVSGIGNKDSVGDICATGAFAKSLQRRKPRVVWGHNWNDPIGKVLEIYEVPASDARLPMKMKMAGIGGLYAKVQFNLQSEKGKEAFANVAFFGEEQEWSIGYKTLRAQYDDNLQANVLYEVELYEVSPVLHGANQLTGTISVKSDEEKMHGMIPMVVGAPMSQGSRAEGLFDEGVSQRISGPQLAGVVAELSRRAAGPVMVVEATENSIVFVKPGKGKFRIGYHFTGSEYMFGKPELIQAEQARPQIQSGPSPIPGVSAKPTVAQRPPTNNPAMAMPVAVKPGNGGMVMVPLPQVEYDGASKEEQPELGAEETELAESLVRIAKKYGKFDEDGDGIWAGYYPPAENKVKDIGVKCSNCVLYLGGDKCKILDLKVEPEGKCRFAIIPDGVVVGFGKKQYNDILDDDEIKMVEDIEAKYPGEFILGVLRNTVKKRRKKRRSYKTLEEWGTEERELEEKGLDSFLAQDQSYVIPVNLEDAFYFKSVIDPVLEYHRIDTTVNEYGIVINSPLDQESKDAISAATNSAYALLKKKITSSSIEEKALGRGIGRAIASRGIDRPNLGGKRGRRSRGSGINPPPGWDPRTVEDANLNSMVGDGTPWEQPDPTPSGPGSINSPKPSKTQIRQRADLANTEKLSSGTRNLRRHADRSEDMEKQFPNAEENQKRIDHEAIAKAWEEQGLGWQEVPRYNSDSNFSSDYLRGREIGVNQSRVMWNGDSVKKRPAKFNEKAKASIEYSDWFSSYMRSVGAYLDAHSKDNSDNWDGIESALVDDVKAKYPDVRERSKEYIASLNQRMNDLGLLSADELKKKKKKKGDAEKEKGPDLQELRKLNSEGKLSSGGKKKPTKEELAEAATARRAKKYEKLKNEGNGEELDLPWGENGRYKPRNVVSDEIDDEVLDEEDDGLTPKERAEERALERAMSEFSKITDEEMAARIERGRASRERLFSPEGIEKRRLEAVKRNRGKETSSRNADGTVKKKPGLSSGGKDESNREEQLAERLKEIDGLSTEETFIPYKRGVLARGPQPSELQREIYEEFKRYVNSDDVWDYLNTRYGVEKSDYKYRRGDDGYFGEDEPNYDLDEAVKDSMSEEDMRNFLKAAAEYEASPNYDAYKKGGPLYDESNKDRKLSSGRTAGRDGFAADSEKQEMDAADESLRNFLNEFDGWDDEEWEFGNQLDSAVERWASANEDMPFINTSVEEMIDEMGADESIQGRNKLAFLENLQQSLFDAQYRARSMSDDEMSRDRLERSVRRSERDFDEGVFSSGRTAGRGRFVADLEKQMAKDTEPLDVSAYGASQYEMFNTSRNNDPQDDFDVEVQDELQSHQDGAKLVGHTVKLTDGRRGVVVSGTGPKYELLERGEFVRGKRLVRMSAGDITVLVTTDKDGNTLDKFVEEDFDFDLESYSRVVDSTMDWDKEIEESKTDDTVGALVEKNRIADSLLEQVSKSDRLSSGGRGGNRSSSKLSSGRDASRILGRSIEKPETEKLITSDREIFERRMGGESLAETATALGIRREDVAQAEKRHMARMRGTLSTLDADDAEAYRQEQYRMAEEDAADEALDRYINEKISSGSSLDAVAKELSISKEQVRARNNSYIDFLKAEDAAAEEFLSRVSVRRSSGNQGPPRSERDYVSPLEGMEPGQKLSSGKMDEVYRSVQEKLIEQIEKIQETGDGKWEFPWHKTALPKNVTNNNRPYSGINSMMLMFRQDSMGYKTPLWAGFNQWKKEGGTVRKGEKGTMIMIPTVFPKKKDADGKEIASSGGIFFKTGHVFNIDQIDGIDKDKFKIIELPEAERVAELEQALSEVGAVVNHGGDRAFYRPSTDEITLPPFASFKSKEGYYAVFAHELMHWTGHSSRLNRDHLGDFGSPEYAQEELVAEIASAFFMAAHGLTPEPREDHAQYLAGWLKKLKSDPDAMKKAFGEAQKAHDFAISKSPSMSKKLGKKVAEAGAIPGNDDGGYGEITPSLSSGARDRYVRNPEGTIRTLADEMGAFGDELLTRFQMAQGSRDGDRNWFEDYAELGESRSLNQWNISEDEFGNWSAELLRLEFGNGYTEREPAGLVSNEFKSPEDAAKWIASYESTRQDWSKKFKQEKDVEKISSMLDEELVRRDAEYQEYARISRERSDRQQYVRMIADINESRLDWTMDDWADEAGDIQMELSRENSRLSSGALSRYDNKPVEQIGMVSDALKRTDEAGSNARHIALNLLMVPVEKYDFDAIRKNGKAISFDYGGKLRTVYPTGMMTNKGGGIYFIGLDEDSGQYRSFSLHKIDGIIDGADAPYNPTQPGVPQGAPRSSGQRTRNVVSDRVSGDRGLSSGRSPEDIKSDFANRVESNNLIVKAALDDIRNPASNPRATRSRNSMFFPIEQHGDALRGVDELVSAKYEFIRSVLDGKKITPKDNYFPRVGDLFEYMSEDDFDFVDDLSMAINRITEGLVSNEELLEWVNEQTDYLRGNISDLGRMHDDPSNRWRSLDFDTAMQLHIDNSDGDNAEALDSMLIDANFIEATLKEVDNFYRNSRNEPDVSSLKTQIDGIEDIINEVDETTTPQDFAAKLSNFYSSTMKKLDRELTDLFRIQGDFEKNGVSLDRYKIDAPDLPEDILAPSGSGPASVANAADGNKLSSGKKTRTQGAKRRPMSDADRQAFADGVRQRAATIPGKRRPGPSKNEFGNDRLSSGRLRFPDDEARGIIGEYLAEKVKVKFGRMSENNDRAPDGKWMLDVKKLDQILKDEEGNPLDREQIARFLGLSERELEKMFQDGAGISEVDAYEIIDRAFFGGRDPGKSYETLDAIWGFDSAPYWYDLRRGNQLTRTEYEDYKEEGIAMAPQFYPNDFELPEQFVGREVSKGSFPVSALAESLGIESLQDLAEAIAFEVDGEQITFTREQIRKWEKQGVPTGLVEQLVDRGVIPSAGDVFGEEGVKFDNSIRQFDLWKNIRNAIERSGAKVKYDDLDRVVGATKVLRRLKNMEDGKEAKYSRNVGKALRYSDDEVQEIVNRLNKKYNLDETVESIKGGGSMSSGRRAARRISNSGQEAVDKLSSGRKNNGAPDNITPRIQNEIIGWAKNAKWSGFAQSVLSQFETNGFLSPSQWTKLLQLRDNSQRRR